MVRDVASWFLIGWETATLYRLGTLARALADHKTAVMSQSVYSTCVHLGTTSKKKNGKKSDIVHLSNYPLPPYPKNDKSQQSTGPSLLEERMTN